jgi:hypothetical protein
MLAASTVEKSRGALSDRPATKKADAPRTSRAIQMPIATSATE